MGPCCYQLIGSFAMEIAKGSNVIGWCSGMSAVSRRGVSTWQRERALAGERKRTESKGKKIRLIVEFLMSALFTTYIKLFVFPLLHTKWQ